MEMTSHASHRKVTAGRKPRPLPPLCLFTEEAVRLPGAWQALAGNQGVGVGTAEGPHALLHRQVLARPGRGSLHSTWPPGSSSCQFPDGPVL